MSDSLKTNHTRSVLAIFVIAAAVASSCSNDASTKSESSAETNSTPQNADAQHKVEFHEIGTIGEREDGWVRAESSTGGFTVLLPGKYNDFQQSVKTIKGNQLITHHVGMTTSEGVKYSVTAFEGGDPTPPDEYLSGVVANFEKSGNVREKKELELDGNLGVQVLMVDSRSSATIRVYAVEGTFYLLIAECPIALTSSEIANVDKFLESFEPK